MQDFKELMRSASDTAQTRPTTPDKKTWTDNRISDFPDISDIVDFRHFYKSIWDQDQS